jgi:transposase
MNRGKLAKTLFLGLGLALLADPLAGYAQAEELNAEELYNLCSRFPFNSSCEGYEVPIALADRPGSRISCSLALNNPATSDRCKLLVTDEQLTLYFEYGDRVSFLNDSRATEEIPIPFTNILALNLRLWRYELDAFSIFFGGNYYVLDDTEYENLNSNFGNWSPQQNCLIANGAKVCSIRVMKSPRPEPTLPEIDPEEQGARYWYERYCEQLAETEQLKRRVKELEKQFESLNEKLRKLSERTSETSSQPPSSDGPKKPNRDQQKPQRKRGPKYNHPGTTRNGFGWINHAELLDVQNCPICGGAVERQPQGTQRQQVAELVPELVEVWEYERPLYRCPACGWQGYQDLPLGCREGFSYGGRLSSVVGWLGYGGNLSWSKQRYVVESIFGIPMSQGSLAKLHQWFCEALQPAYEQWWTWIQQPGVRCVDETSYRLNGVNHWIWIATAPECCVLFFAPSRSSAEVKTLLGEDFAGILSSDCWSAYGPQSAVAKQKCWAHLQRELKALTTSRFPENREFAHRVFPIIHTARQAHRDYHQGQLSLAELQALRPIVEAELADVLEHPHQGRWAADSQALSNRFRRHWSDWFTFLTSPAVSPDNNEAERGLRPVVIHRKVTGGARSDWGAQLVAMMFSCLESMRRQGKNAVDHLFELIASSGCSPPALLPG